MSELRSVAMRAAEILRDYVELASMARHCGRAVTYSPRCRLAVDTDAMQRALMRALEQDRADAALTQDAFRIADESSESLIRSAGVARDAWTITLLSDECAPGTLVADAIDYLVRRGSAQRADDSGLVCITLSGDE
jgi:hypothetical protein